MALGPFAFRCPQNLGGNGPHASRPRTSNGPGAPRRVCAACHEASGAFTEPARRFPTDVLEDEGRFCESQWQRSTDCSAIARGPGAGDQDAAGMGVPGVGTGALPALCPGGRCCRGQAQEFHACSWRLKTGQGTHGCPRGDRAGALDAPQGLKGFAPRGQTPGLALLWEGLRQPLESFGVGTHGPDIFLKDELLRRGGPDAGGEPPPGGRVPSGPAHVTDSWPE
jgi:hypothetical protein